MPSWIARRTRLLRGGRVPNSRPGLADPVQKWLAALHVRRTLVTTRAEPWPGTDGSAWASSSCWRGCGSGCPPPGRGSASAAATTPRSPCPAAPPRPRSTRSSRASTSAASRRRLGQIGHKALATALSDLAAMGAEPGEAYVVLGVPPDLDEDGCLELLDGIARARRRDRHDPGRRRRHPRRRC